MGSTNESTRIDLIRKKAYELFLQRGRSPGKATDDWLTAEKLVDRELREKQTPVTAASPGNGSPAIGTLAVGSPGRSEPIASTRPAPASIPAPERSAPVKVGSRR